MSQPTIDDQNDNVEELVTRIVDQNKEIAKMKERIKQLERRNSEVVKENRKKDEIIKKYEIEKDEVRRRFRNFYLTYNDSKGGSCIRKHPKHLIEIDPFRRYNDNFEVYRKTRAWYGGDHGVGWLAVTYNPPNQDLRPNACVLQ